MKSLVWGLSVLFLLEPAVPAEEASHRLFEPPGAEKPSSSSAPLENSAPLSGKSPVVVEASAAESGEKSASRTENLAGRGPEILGVRVGWAGRYKVGYWAPVEVWVRGGTAPGQALVVLELPDSEGTVACFGVRVQPEQVLRWKPGEEIRYLMYAMFGQNQSGFTVALHEPTPEGEGYRAGRRLATKRIEVRSAEQDAQVPPVPTGPVETIPPGLWPTQLLVVSIGADSVGLEEAVRPVELIGALQWPADRAPVVVRLSEPESVRRLPRRWYGYEGVDLVVVSTSRPELLQPLGTDPEQQAALEEWVRLGGKLAVFLGKESAWLAGQGGVWARLLPGRVVGSATLRSATGYEMYADSTRPVPGMGRPERAILAPRWTQLEGLAAAQQGDVPVVIRRPFGLGEVVVLAGDFDRPPLSDWPDRGRLLRKALALPLPKEEQSGEGGALLHSGYRDISGQFRSALDQFEGLPMVSFWPVAGLMLLYILLIGPGDYLFLRKLLGRMHWTWLTFSTLVVLAAAGAYALSVYLKGRHIRSNQVDVVDVDTASGQVRGATWINLFSPRTDAYTLSLQPFGPDGQPLEKVHSLLSSIGLAGEGLGGMRTRPGSVMLWDRPYHWSPEADQVLGLPVHVWSSRLVLGRWWGRATAWPQAHLVDRDQLPEGELRNTLPVVLEECILAYGRWGYALGRLEPGQSVHIEPMSRLRIELPTLLGGGGGQVGTAGWAATGRKPYNPQSHDLGEILQTMMFFDSIGGQSYTGLCHRYHGWLDGSGWLRQGRAVLVAQVQRPPDWPTPAQNGTADGIPGAVVLRDGQPLAHPAEDQHLVFVRFVYPVEPSRPR